MRTVPTAQLFTIPDATVFFEDDFPMTALFQKVGTSAAGDDVMVISLCDDGRGESRLGIRDMDECDRNSKAWKVLEEDDINAMIGRLMLVSVAP